MRWVLRSKIHQAKVTETHLDYVGSLTIDQDLIEKAGLWPGEKVLVVSNTTGARLETYVIGGERGSGVIGAMLTALREAFDLSWIGQASTQSPQPVQSSAATW